VFTGIYLFIIKVAQEQQENNITPNQFFVYFLRDITNETDEFAYSFKEPEYKKLKN
jgi:hypothetical protein